MSNEFPMSIYKELDYHMTLTISYSTLRAVEKITFMQLMMFLAHCEDATNI